MPQQGPWRTVRDHLAERIPALGPVGIDELIAAGAIVGPGGRPITASDPFEPRSVVWLHRELPPEVPVPFEIPVLYRDERILVVDKPHFLATMPRGRHVVQTATTRLREALDLPELSPVHRLDRLTAGVLVFAVEQRWRGPYQSLFASGAVTKGYLAVSGVDPTLTFPRTVRLHLAKPRGSLRSQVVRDREPNSETVIDLERQWPAAAGVLLGRYRLAPRTGRTHQLRAHLAALGLPILGDPLYPRVVPDAELDPTDYSTPLQLLAETLAFLDPVDGAPRSFRSRRRLSADTEVGIR